MNPIDVNDFFIDKFLKTIDKKKKKEKKGSNKQSKKKEVYHDDNVIHNNDTLTWEEIENQTNKAETLVECEKIEIIM